MAHGGIFRDENGNILLVTVKHFVDNQEPINYTIPGVIGEFGQVWEGATKTWIQTDLIVTDNNQIDGIETQVIDLTTFPELKAAIKSGAIEPLEMSSLAGIKPGDVFALGMPETANLATLVFKHFDDGHMAWMDDIFGKTCDGYSGLPVFKVKNLVVTNQAIGLEAETWSSRLDGACINNAGVIPFTQEAASSTN